MKRLELNALTIEGFRSFAGSATIEFGEPGGLRMLFGKNEVEPRLGGNGAGKSTMWDALCWCLFGFSARNLRASDLMNWSRKQNPHVIANLLINDAPFAVERFGSPNRLLLDGEPVEQDKLEREVLGISRARFMHSVLFGQMVRLFIDLSVPERGALLDEVLDLGLWLRASDAANARHRGMTAEMQTIEKALAFSRGKLEGLENEDTIRAREDAWTAEHDAVIEAAIKRVEEAELSLTSNKIVLQRTPLGEEPAADVLKLEQRRSKANTILQGLREKYAVTIADSKRLKAERDFLADHPDRCPTCSQPISEDFAAPRVHEYDERIVKIAMEQTSLFADAKLADGVIADLQTHLDNERRKQQEAHVAYARAEAAFKSQQHVVDLAVEAAEREASVTNPHTALRDSVRAQRSALQREIGAQRLKLGGIKEQLASLDYWRQGFKRVRLFQTKQSLDLLRLEVANAAQSLGLLGWTIDFATEVETKSGSMKQGVQIVVTSPQASGSWEVWSGGEGQRIRLAVAIGLASLIQRMAGVFYTFEIWDEPSAWLSPEGITDLLDCLAQRAQITGKTVWVVDHRALDVGMFSQVWQITKTNTGSSVQRIS